MTPKEPVKKEVKFKDSKSRPQTKENEDKEQTYDLSNNDKE